MDMTIPVTLIVKAPNQQIEDQTIKCESSWTIRRLKGHLSEVYPSKPAQDEQKLIYSGQLLSDTVVLKDVLRNYDGQDTHTVHLVCTPSKFRVENTRKESEIMVQSTNASNANSSNPSPEPSPSPSLSGLRQRMVNSQETNTDFRNLWANLQYGNITDPSQYAMQAAIVHQAYIQYINQYMQMVTNQLPQQRPPETPEPEVNQEQPQEAAARVEEPPADENNQDDQQMERDWLDWFYFLSRVLILFSIVYYYSSPLRFCLVLLLGIGFYLYHTGLLRTPVINNNENQSPENNNQQEGQTEAPVEQRPTMLNIMWTFFTTFFASLIPQIPNAV